MKSILFVCLGNICRSPMAEGILRHKLSAHQLDIMVDSAGTISWHAGQPPDNRAVKAASLHGVDLSKLRGRHFSVHDFDRFDLILAMDAGNRKDILQLARNNSDRLKVQLCLTYAGDEQDRNVPDPYYGEFDDFLDLYQLLDETCEKIIMNILNNT